MLAESAHPRHPDSHHDHTPDDRWTYYEAQCRLVEESPIEEDGLWHLLGDGNRQKLKPRYE